MVNNYEDFSTDLYASHLLRTAFQCAAGHREMDRQRKSQQDFERLQMASLSFKSFLHTSETMSSFLEILSIAVDKAVAVNKFQGSFLRQLNVNSELLLRFTTFCCIFQKNVVMKLFLL